MCASRSPIRGATCRFSSDSIQPYAVADFPSLADAARHYLDATHVHVDRTVSSRSPGASNATRRG